jgi:hypothetical protein
MIDRGKPRAVGAECHGHADDRSGLPAEDEFLRYGASVRSRHRRFGADGRLGRIISSDDLLGGRNDDPVKTGEDRDFE